MTERNLDTLKDKLWNEFEVASDASSRGYEKSRIAMGTIAQAIVAIESEQREANESVPRRLEGRDKNDSVEL